MKQGWEIRQLGDLVAILDTKRKPITKRDRNPGEFPYYGATGIVDYVDDYIFDEQLILLGEDGAKWNSGDQSAFIITGKTWVNNHAHVLKPYRDILIDQWLVYNLNHQNLLSFVTGLTVPKLNQGKTKEISIPIPPLEEQKRIVAKLDQCFEAIDKAKANAAKNLENAKELFQSKLNDIFSQKGEGWVEKKLGDVCSLEYGKPLPKEDRDPDGLYPAYGANGIKTRTDKFLVNGRSIIVGRKGSAGEINYTEDKFWALDVTYYTKFDSNILDLDFLYYLLNLLKLPKLAKGVKPGINRNDVYAITIQLPPLKEQSKIAIEMKHLGNIR